MYIYNYIILRCIISLIINTNKEHPNKYSQNSLFIIFKNIVNFEEYLIKLKKKSKF